MAYEYFSTSWGYQKTLSQLKSFLETHWHWDDVVATPGLEPDGSTSTTPYVRFCIGDAYIEISSTHTDNVYFRNFLIKVHSNGVNRGTPLSISGGYCSSGTNYCHLYKNDNGIILVFDWAPASARSNPSSLAKPFKEYSTGIAISKAGEVTVISAFNNGNFWTIHDGQLSNLNATNSGIENPNVGQYVPAMTTDGNVAKHYMGLFSPVGYSVLPFNIGGLRLVGNRYCALKNSTLI